MINYFAVDYDDKRRWASYWYQIKEILDFNPKKVLIIGEGNGLVSEYLKLSDMKIVVLDIDEALNPDVVASVLKMPFRDNEFDAVLCAQVLEHLPYEDFGQALSEIKRVAKIGAVISLPHFGPAIRFLFKFPFFPEIKFMIKLPYPKVHKFKDEHYWEIGKRGYSLKKIKKEIMKSGFVIGPHVFEFRAH